MRPISGPAERLDTYGGYVTYHNASYVALFLALWAAIQGARAIRGWEERGTVEVWLSTGRHRLALLTQRWAGFLVALVAISLGIAAGYWAGTAAARASDWEGAGIVALETALVAATFFAAALLISQLTKAARSGAGFTTIAMLAMYLTANMYPDLGGFAWLRFLSPFFYFQQSRALVPGHSMDAAATAILVLWATVPAALAALAFERRAVGARLWERPAPLREARAGGLRLRAPRLRDAWLADLRSQWVSLALWSIGGAGITALMASVANQVATVWESSELIKQMFLRTPGSSFLDQYMSYVTILGAITPAAFVVAEASRWVGDISEGRTEALLAVTGSRSRVALEWALGTVAGVVVVSVAVIAGCLGGAAMAGVGLRADSLVRTAADSILLGTAVCGIALLAVVVVRNGAAIGVLGAILGVGYFVTLFASLFNWPEWVARLSPFDAYGTPYASVPKASGMALLAALALAGGFAAVVVARRRSSLT